MHLLDPNFLKYVNKMFLFFTFTNVDIDDREKPTPDIIWGVFKANFRGMIISSSDKVEYDLEIKNKEHFK